MLFNTTSVPVFLSCWRRDKRALAIAALVCDLCETVRVEMVWTKVVPRRACVGGIKPLLYRAVSKLREKKNVVIPGVVDGPVRIFFICWFTARIGF